MVSFGGNENVLKWIAVMIAQLCEYILKATELHTLNGDLYISYRKKAVNKTNSSKHLRALLTCHTHASSYLIFMIIA